MTVRLGKYPVLESDKRPKSKEKPGNELADVRRDIKVVRKPIDDPEVDEVVDTHKDNETSQLAWCLATLAFFIEHPLAISDKEQRVSDNARRRESGKYWPMREFMEQEEPDVGTPEQDVARELKFYELDEVCERELFFDFFHCCPSL